MIADHAGRLLADRYVLNRELGRGGMGSVWEADDTTLGRAVAIKMMSKALSGDAVAVERFEREAKAVARLHSRHIVELHDYGVDKGNAFMVMELLRGRDLKARLRQEGALPIDEVARIVAQVAKALTMAHAAGIVHRDLKPGNIFLVREVDEEYVKVFDFGIATAFRSTQKRERKLTEEGLMMGTPRYMSPEQLTSDESDPRDDVWSLSVIAYRAICGGIAFPGKGIAEIVERVLATTPRPPSHHLSSLPPEVDALFERAFLTDRAARFQSARELANALVEIADISASLSIIKPRQPSQPLVVTEDDDATRVLPRDDDDTRVIAGREATGPLGMSLAQRRRRPWRWAIAAMVLVPILAGMVWVISTPPAMETTAAPAAAAEQSAPPPDVSESAPSTAPSTAAPPEPSNKPSAAASASAAPALAPLPRPRRPLPRPSLPAPPKAKSKQKKKDDLFGEVY